jgi:hypothetical protein
MGLSALVVGDQHFVVVQRWFALWPFDRINVASDHPFLGELPIDVRLPGVDRAADAQGIIDSRS